MDEFTQQIANDAFLRNIRGEMAAAQQSGDVAAEAALLQRLQGISGGDMPQPLTNRLQQLQPVMQQPVVQQSPQQMMTDLLRTPT